MDLRERRAQKRSGPLPDAGIPAACGGHAQRPYRPSIRVLRSGTVLKRTVMRHKVVKSPIRHLAVRDEVEIPIRELAQATGWRLMADGRARCPLFPVPCSLLWKQPRRFHNNNQGAGDVVQSVPELGERPLPKRVLEHPEFVSESPEVPKVRRLARVKRLKPHSQARGA